MATVYRALDTSLNQEVAVKILHFTEHWAEEAPDALGYLYIVSFR